ncbi:MAG: phosphoadenylyl-sulfate reductase, partial [Saprospiraceae bacterium]|nr:phosphoadenylyl-sulfate reductase [Saprospiraceae bacterium]
DIPIYFVNTGFHFPETFQFRDEIAAQLKLSVISVSSPIDKIQQRAQDGSFIFMKDPDHCCHMNKVLPLEPILQNHDIWINGIRKDQTDFRESLRHEEKAPFNTLRFHPMLNWTSQMIWAYRQHFNLPAHPLEEKGYFSIGCMPCSRSFVDSPAERSGRWHGLKKTECGIHTELTQK